MAVEITFSVVISVVSVVVVVLFSSLGVYVSYAGERIYYNIHEVYNKSKFHTQHFYSYFEVRLLNN